MADQPPENFDLDRRHPSQALTRPVRIKSRDLFAGEEVIKSKRSKEELPTGRMGLKSTYYLPKTENESPKDYNRRLFLSVYDNYLESVVRTRQGLIFRNEPVRELPEKMKQYLEDIDNQGTTARQFFDGVSEKAQVEGLTWVLVDMPVAKDPDPGLGTRTLKQETDDGLRTFAQIVSADNVLDWKTNDKDRKLDWAVIRQARQKGERKPGFPIELVEQRKVWTRIDWTIYEKDSTNTWILAKDPATGKPATGPNTTDKVPLVPFYGIKIDDFVGVPVTKDILGHCVAIYNKGSDSDFAIYMTNNPIPYTIGPQVPKKLAVGSGFHLFSQADMPEPKLGYMEPTGSGLEASRQSKLDLIRRIFEIALLQAKRDGAQVQSADGQREDKGAFTSSLMNVSRSLESSEKSVWELWQAWDKDTGEVRIEYNRDFDDTMIDAQMIDTLSKLVTLEHIPVQDFLQILVKNEILPSDYDVAEAVIKLKMQDDLRGPAPSAQFLNAVGE